MSVPHSPKQRDEEKDLYSSSSDEEEKKRLESAVWKVNKNNSYYEKKGTVETNGVVPLSKRESLDDSTAFTADFRTVDTTPEYKNFMAKKLTAYLDGILEDLEEEPKKRPMKYEQPDDDSFQLFSTSSKSYIPQKINYPQPKWKREQQKRRRQGKESSSSSDSEEEKKKLEAAAVSGDFILGGAKRVSSSHQEDTENGEEEPSSQVTSNPDCSILTHNAPHLDSDSVENIFHKKKKKKKTSKEYNFDLVRSSCEGSNVVTSSGNDVVRTSKRKKKKRKKEKSLLGDVSKVVQNSERLNDDQAEETAHSEKVSNVADTLETAMVYSNSIVEHSSNCKKKKKRKRKKELENV